jgi:hypothetical protein
MWYGHEGMGWWMIFGGIFYVAVLGCNYFSGSMGDQ